METIPIPSPRPVITERVGSGSRRDQGRNIRPDGISHFGSSVHTMVRTSTSRCWLLLNIPILSGSTQRPMEVLFASWASNPLVSPASPLRADFQSRVGVFHVKRSSRKT